MGSRLSTWGLSVWDSGFDNVDMAHYLRLCLGTQADRGTAGWEPARGSMARDRVVRVPNKPNSTPSAMRRTCQLIEFGENSSIPNDAFFFVWNQLSGTVAMLAFVELG